MITNKDVQIAKIEADASILNNKMRYDLNRDVAKMKIDRDIEIEKIRKKKSTDHPGLWRLLEILISIILVIVSMVACFNVMETRNGREGAPVFFICVAVFIMAIVLFSHSIKKKS